MDRQQEGGSERNRPQSVVVLPLRITVVMTKFFSSLIKNNMFEETLPVEMPKQMVSAASDDRWLVECLTLAAVAALATSQILGENVLVSLL